MHNHHRHIALLCALFPVTAFAQEDPDSSSTGSTWRASTIARCEQQYSAEQCQDEQFLEENFHVATLEVAHRAATRNAQLERDALRELTLQRECDKSTSSICASAAQPEQCAVQIVQACATLATQAANCAQNAQTQCAAEALGSECIKQKIVFCPSLKKQPIGEFLAKYPALRSDQKIRLTNAAQQLDAQQGNWLSNLLDWIGI